MTGETIIGANVFRDFLAGVRDFFGGRSASYEERDVRRKEENYEITSNNNKFIRNRYV